MSSPAARPSRFWQRAFPIEYRLVRLAGVFVQPFWRAWGLGNIVELEVPGRRTGVPRRVLLGLLRSDGHWFLGHPNGDVAWTRNLEAAGRAELTLRWPARLPVRASRLEPGPLRDSAILATGQHVFPGNLIYRLARGHIRAVGTYFEITLEDSSP